VIVLNRNKPHLEQRRKYFKFHQILMILLYPRRLLLTAVLKVSQLPVYQISDLYRFIHIEVELF